MMYNKFTKNNYITLPFLFFTIISKGYTCDKYSKSIHFKNNTQWSSTKTDTIIPDGTKSDESIVILAKAYGDSIVLRFAPPNFAFWQRIKNSGFVIKRGIDPLNTKVIATIKPIPLDKIDTSLFSKDSMVLVAAGLLCGEHDRSQIEGGIQEYRANEQLLNMSLMVAEFSPLAATILGFRYTDKMSRQVPLIIMKLLMLFHVVNAAAALLHGRKHQKTIMNTGVSSSVHQKRPCRHASHTFTDTGSNR